MTAPARNRRPDWPTPWHGRLSSSPLDDIVSSVTTGSDAAPELTLDRESFEYLVPKPQWCDPLQIRAAVVHVDYDDAAIPGSTMRNTMFTAKPMNRIPTTRQIAISCWRYLD